VEDVESIAGILGSERGCYFQSTGNVADGHFKVIGTLFPGK